MSRIVPQDAGNSGEKEKRIIEQALHDIEQKLSSDTHPNPQLEEKIAEVDQAIQQPAKAKLTTEELEQIEEVLTPPFRGSEKLYELLGVRLWKKYQPASGELVTRRKRRKAGLPETPVPLNIQDIERAILTTRLNENMHLPLLIIGIIMATVAFLNGKISAGALAATWATLGEFYPVITMRHTRLRLIRIAEKLKRREERRAERAARKVKPAEESESPS